MTWGGKGRLLEGYRSLAGLIKTGQRTWREWGGCAGGPNLGKQNSERQVPGN